MTIRRTVAAASALGLCLVALWTSGASAATRTTPACTADSLSAKQTATAAGMSQPASYITVTNTGDSACTLKGYPTLTGAWTKQGQQQISVTNGAVMNAPETKPKRITLAPGGKAWFAVGAGTAYDSAIVTFRRIAFAMTAGATTADSVIARVTLQANAPTGKPYPLGVTAFAPGAAPAGD